MEVAAGKRNLAAAACGLLAVLLAVVVPIAAGRLEPGYSHRSQFISELGAQGAANAAAVSLAGFAPIGALVLAFLAFAHGTFPGTQIKTAGTLCLGMVGIAYLIAALFPCDAGCPGSGSLSQSVHNTFGFFEYIGAVVGLILLGSAFRESIHWRPLVAACLALVPVVAAALAAMLTPQLAPVRGLSQRLAEAAIFGWIAIVSVFLLRSRS
jgi:hypothetical protein